MIYNYAHPHTSFKPIDTAPIEARLWLIHSLIMRMVDIGWAQRILPLAQKTRRLVRVLAQASAHNLHVERKLAMLSSPLWRERVLRDLGGMRKLKLWEAAMLRARGISPLKPRISLPEKPEPVWWRSLERVAESARLKARFRLSMDAALNPLVFRDPYKMDFEGEFRLAPLPRKGAIGPRLPRIYSKVDICEYNYNEVPIRKPEGFGPALVWPLEFYAAMELEVEGDTRGLNGVVTMMGAVREDNFHIVIPDALSPVLPDKGITRRSGPHQHDTALNDGSRITCNLQSKLHSVRDDINNDDSEEDTPDFVPEFVPEFVPDFLPLPLFLGAALHDALFLVPP